MGACPKSPVPPGDLSFGPRENTAQDPSVPAPGKETCQFGNEESSVCGGDLPDSLPSYFMLRFSQTNGPQMRSFCVQSSPSAAISRIPERRRSPAPGHDLSLAHKGQHWRPAAGPEISREQTPPGGAAHWKAQQRSAGRIGSPKGLWALSQAGAHAGDGRVGRSDSRREMGKEKGEATRRD